MHPLKILTDIGVRHHQTVYTKLLAQGSNSRSTPSSASSAQLIPTPPKLEFHLSSENQCYIGETWCNFTFYLLPFTDIKQSSRYWLMVLKHLYSRIWLFSMLLSRLDLGQLTKRPAGGAQPTIPSAQAFSSIPVCHQTLPVTQPACEKMERNYIPTDCQFPAHVAHRVWKHLITRTGVVQWLVCFNLISVTVLTSDESQPKIHSQGLHFN